MFHTSTKKEDLFCQLSMKKHDLFCALKNNFLFCEKKKIDPLHVTMRSVLSCWFPLKYKNKGLFYTDCGCDLDPLILTYNNCDDDFPNRNDFDISLFIPDNNSVRDLCVYSAIKILKKIKDSFHEIEKNELMEFSKKNDVLVGKKNNQNLFCLSCLKFQVS